MRKENLWEWGDEEQQDFFNNKNNKNNDDVFNEKKREEEEEEDHVMRMSTVLHSMFHYDEWMKTVNRILSLNNWTYVLINQRIEFDFFSSSHHHMLLLFFL